MKSEHRHELKTNELAEWLANFPQWAKRNRTTIIYVSVLIVVIAGSYFYHRYRKDVVSVQNQIELTRLISRLNSSRMQIVAAQSQGMDVSYMLIQAADNLGAAAQNAKNDTAALALIKQGQALRSELHYRPGVVDKQDIVAQIGRAVANYNDALTKATSPSLIAMAKFALGLCEEELGNFDKAEQMYSEIAGNPDFEGTIAAAQAKLRLETMADYRQEIVFKASPIKSVAKPQVVPAEAVQPQIKLTPADINTAPDPNLQPSR